MIHIQKWEKFIPQQFVAVGKDRHCVTFQCTNQEATEFMKLVESEFVGKVWVVDCKVAGAKGSGSAGPQWMQSASDVCTYSVSFENYDDYQKFLRKYDTAG